jgi:anti-sigma regulatory factor (Ser/Thr protein kinase)
MAAPPVLPPARAHVGVRMPIANGSCVRMLRDYTAAWLDAWALAALADNAVLAVSEYATNVMRHTDSELVELHLSQLPGTLMIEVVDFGNPVTRENPDEVDEPKAEDLTVGGLGLPLVAALASRTWQVRNPGMNGETRVALFEL